MSSHPKKPWFQKQISLYNKGSVRQYRWTLCIHGSCIRGFGSTQVPWTRTWPHMSPLEATKGKPESNVLFWVLTPALKAIMNPTEAADKCTLFLWASENPLEGASFRGLMETKTINLITFNFWCLQGVLE